MIDTTKIIFITFLFSWCSLAIDGYSSDLSDTEIEVESSPPLLPASDAVKKFRSYLDSKNDERPKTKQALHNEYLVFAETNPDCYPYSLIYFRTIWRLIHGIKPEGPYEPSSKSFEIQIAIKDFVNKKEELYKTWTAFHDDWKASEGPDLGYYSFTYHLHKILDDDSTSEKIKNFINNSKRRQSTTSNPNLRQNEKDNG